MENPKNLEEAIQFLIDIYTEEKSLEKIKSLSEEEYLSGLHHGPGTNLRNKWNLWWFKDHKYDTWPKEKPEIVEYFNSIGITHADDMSGIIFTSTYRKIQGLDPHIDNQVKKYQNNIDI